MFRFGVRLVSVGGKSLKQNCCITEASTLIPALKPRSLLHVSTLHSVKRSLEDPTSPRTNSRNPQMNSIMKYIEDLGFNESEIQIAIENQPGLLKKSPVLWNDVLGSLMYYGMEKENILSMLERWPHILSLKKSVLDKNLIAWFGGSKFGEELTKIILTTHPNLLQVSDTIVQKRINQFQTYFESKKSVGKLLLLAPNVLDEDLDELLDKLNYLDELCTDKIDLVKTGVLAHSAFHIRARHEFLIRAGIYKRPAKDFKKRLSKNVKLNDIVNSSDEVFASKIAGLSLLEYEVFLEMYEKEFSESKDYHVDSSDDEEELNKLSYAKHPKNSRRQRG